MPDRDADKMRDPLLSSVTALAISTLRYVSYAGMLVCAVGLFLAFLDSYPLWVHSAKAEGFISGYKTVSWQSRRVFGGASTSSVSAHLPVITFQTQTGENVLFVDNYGYSRLSMPGEKVAVIYETDNPSNAIADKGFTNWMSIYIWLFGLTASALGVLRFRKLGLPSLPAQ